MVQELRKVKDAFHKLNYILSSEQKKYGILILILSLVAAVLETLGVTAILPLMQAMLDAPALMGNKYVRPFIDFFGISSPGELILLICIGVILVYVIKNVYFIFYTWASKKYTYKVKRELSSRVLNAYLKQGYIFFVNHNSSRLLQGIGADISGVYTIINNLFQFITKAFTIVAIGIFIIVQSPFIAVSLLALVIICIILIQLIYSKSMKKNGELQRIHSWDCTQTSLEAIQGNKEIIVMHRQKFFMERYADSMEKMNRTSIKVDMGAIAPTYIIETVCIAGLLIVVALQITHTDNAFKLISQLSAIAVAAFRILPSVGSITSAINTITFNTPAMNAAYETLNQVKELEKTGDDKWEKWEDGTGGRKIEFKDKLEIQNIFYRYPNTEEYVLENLNMTIKAGTSVAFIGASGAGKTTLADIVLSLLEPCGGDIKMDGVSISELGAVWNRIVGYVPQRVYLVDDSIRKNIAFGVAEADIEDERIWRALELAQLKEFVMGLPDRLDSRVGEWGVRFSGGQRQRIAIARALYDDPEILVMDEATAALDNETETAVMKSIDALQGYKTLIIVAHRLSTIRNCDEIYEIKDGGAHIRTKVEVFSED